MGMYKRKLSDGREVCWISFMFERKQVHERVGMNEGVAKRLYRQRKREVAAGTYSREHKSGSVSLEQYAETWGNRRRNRNAAGDRQMLRDYAVKYFKGRRLDSIMERDLIRFAEWLKTRPVSIKTAKNIYGVVRTMFRDAKRRGLIASDPCDLPRGFWGKARGVERKPYSADEVAALTTDPRVEAAQRVWNGLAFYTGMRMGEVCGRRWRDWDRYAAPLGSLEVNSQYQDLPLKQANQPRRVPVHPALDVLLGWWWDEGFRLAHGRQPTEDDWIVPRPTDVAKPLSKSSAQKRFKNACGLAGVEYRTVHATRHTFITWTRRGGAPADVVEKITHNARGTMIDQYTHWDWDPLCQAVLRLAYQQPVLPLAPAANAQVKVAAGAELHDAQHDATRWPSCFDAGRGWRRRESNPDPRGFAAVFVHVRSRIAQATGFVGSATT